MDRHHWQEFPVKVIRDYFNGLGQTEVNAF